MELSKEQQLFAENTSKLIRFILSQGKSCSYGEAYRTPAQAAIYAQQGKGIKDSLHCKRLAIDLNLFDEKGEYETDSEAYRFAGEYWKTLNENNGWGGDWGPSAAHPKQNTDGNHFEMRVQ